MAADFASLARRLSENGVSDVDVRDLEQAVQEDPRPDSIKALGPKVSGWVSKMVMKAAAGTWDISIATAGGFLAEALGKFYGVV
jgi:hypothetical protein